MPREKYLRKNKHNENALTTRLMQISLTMDDHIYCGRLISTSEAAGYLQEIATLKLRCLPTNVRAMQVIEKLTRCMRSILTEEDTSHSGHSMNECFQITSEFTGSTSPVYSLPDEDRIFEIDEQTDAENSDIIHKPEKDETFQNQRNVTQTSHVVSNKTWSYNEQSNKLFDKENTLDGIEIIDITNTSDTDETKNVDKVTKEQNAFIENVNSRMTSMAIHNELSSVMQTDNDSYSQRILDNYGNENTNKVTADQNGTVVEKGTYHRIDGKAYVTKNVNDYFAKCTPLATMPAQTAIIIPVKLVNNRQNADLNSVYKSVKQSKPAPLEKVNNRERKEKIVKRKNDNVSTKRNSKSTVNTNTLHYVQSGQIAKSSKETKNCQKENVPKAIKKLKKQNKKKVHEIYNNNVENDLSWVENIRFVREIGPDEHDPALSLLKDNFWDNFALPDTWNNLDFEY